jgi:hypothetical protein
VGRTLSTWEYVEGLFSNLFAMFMDAPTSVAVRVYGTIVSNSGRRAALKEASESAFHRKRVSPEHRKAWKELVAHYEPASNRRVEIAHGHVVQTAFGSPGHSEEHGFFLMPPSYNTKKTDPIHIMITKKWLDAAGDYRYTSQNIAHFEERFVELSQWASRFQTEYQMRY